MTPIIESEHDTVRVLETLLGDGPILVLAPHPNDAALGCGALLSHAFARDGAHVVCMGGEPHAGSAQINARAHELELAIAHLRGRADTITGLRRPPGWAEQLETFQMLATHVGAVARAIGARRLFSTAPTSEDPEHRATADIASRAAKMYGLDLWHYPVRARWTEATLSAADPEGVLYRLPVGEASAAKARAIAAFSGLPPERSATETSAVADPEVARFLSDDELFFRPGQGRGLSGDVLTGAARNEARGTEPAG